MSPAVSVAKAKPALGAGTMVDGGDVGTVGVVPVFLWLPELEKPLLHTHYEFTWDTFPDPAAQNAFFFSNFAEISVSTRLHANVDFSSQHPSNLGIISLKF